MTRRLKPRLHKENPPTRVKVDDFWGYLIVSQWLNN